MSSKFTLAYLTAAFILFATPVWANELVPIGDSPKLNPIGLVDSNSDTRPIVQEILAALEQGRDPEVRDFMGAIIGFDPVKIASRNKGFELMKQNLSVIQNNRDLVSWLILDLLVEGSRSDTFFAQHIIQWAQRWSPEFYQNILATMHSFPDSRLRLAAINLELARGVDGSKFINPLVDILETLGEPKESYRWASYLLGEIGVAAPQVTQALDRFVDDGQAYRRSRTFDDPHRGARQVAEHTLIYLGQYTQALAERTLDFLGSPGVRYDSQYDHSREDLRGRWRKRVFGLRGNKDLARQVIGVIGEEAANFEELPKHLYVLGAMSEGDPQSIRFLERFLDHPHPDVRVAARVAHLSAGGQDPRAVGTVLHLAVNDGLRRLPVGNLGSRLPRGIIDGVLSALGQASVFIPTEKLPQWLVGTPKESTTAVLKYLSHYGDLDDNYWDFAHNWIVNFDSRTHSARQRFSSAMGILGSKPKAENSPVFLGVLSGLLHAMHGKSLEHMNEDDMAVLARLVVSGKGTRVQAKASHALASSKLPWETLEGFEEGRLVRSLEANLSSPDPLLRAGSLSFFEGFPGRSERASQKIVDIFMNSEDLVELLFAEKALRAAGLESERIADRYVEVARMALGVFIDQSEERSLSPLSDLLHTLLERWPNKLLDSNLVPEVVTVTRAMIERNLESTLPQVHFLSQVAGSEEIHIYPTHQERLREFFSEAFDPRFEFERRDTFSRMHAKRALESLPKWKYRNPQEKIGQDVEVLETLVKGELVGFRRQLVVERVGEVTRALAQSELLLHETPRAAQRLLNVVEELPDHLRYPFVAELGDLKDAPGYPVITRNILGRVSESEYFESVRLQLGVEVPRTQSRLGRRVRDFRMCGEAILALIVGGRR